jgi:hypothetical protein
MTDGKVRLREMILIKPTLICAGVLAVLVTLYWYSMPWNVLRARNVAETYAAENYTGEMVSAGGGYIRMTTWYIFWFHPLSWPESGNFEQDHY